MENNLVLSEKITLFSCDKCTKKFKMKGSLKRHQLEKHTIKNVRLQTRIIISKNKLLKTKVILLQEQVKFYKQLINFYTSHFNSRNFNNTSSFFYNTPPLNEINHHNNNLPITNYPNHQNSHQVQDIQQEIISPSLFPHEGHSSSQN